MWRRCSCCVCSRTCCLSSSSSSSRAPAISHQLNDTTWKSSPSPGCTENPISASLQRSSLSDLMLLEKAAIDFQSAGTHEQCLHALGLGEIGAFSQKENQSKIKLRVNWIESESCAAWPRRGRKSAPTFQQTWASAGSG